MRPEIRDLALEIGASPEAVKKWRQRGGVPHRLRLPLLRKAVERGLEITSSDMDWQPTGSRQEAA